MPKNVTPSMPLNTAVPSDRRISDPAPVATIRGTTPMMKAKEVIRSGRSRNRHASSAPAAQERAQPTQRHPQADRQRHRPTLIEGRQGQEDTQHRQPEDVQGSVAV